jgi:hypothetical protein
MVRISPRHWLALIVSVSVGFVVLPPLLSHLFWGNTVKSSRSDYAWVIRTDFSDDQQWAAIKALISAPQRESGREYYAYVRFVGSDAYRDKLPQDLVHSLPDNYPYKFCFVVDRKCTENPEHPVLVVGFDPRDLKSYKRPPRSTPADEIATFRALPNQIQSIENNLSIANMDFEEFASHVDADGVFRDFPPPRSPSSK